jgi:hypothetical protein
MTKLGPIPRVRHGFLLFVIRASSLFRLSGFSASPLPARRAYRSESRLYGAGAKLRHSFVIRHSSFVIHYSHHVHAAIH